MAVRIGVDVGGTFTKAVACDVATLAIVARAIVPTTHDDPDGVAAGVAAALERVAGEVGGDWWRADHERGPLDDPGGQRAAGG